MASCLSCQFWSQGCLFIGLSLAVGTDYMGRNSQSMYWLKVLSKYCKACLLYCCKLRLFTSACSLPSQGESDWLSTSWPLEKHCLHGRAPDLMHCMCAVFHPCCIHALWVATLQLLDYCHNFAMDFIIIASYHLSVPMQFFICDVPKFCNSLMAKINDVRTSLHQLKSAHS